MRKGTLENGSPIFIVKVEHYIKLGDFATALTDHYYGESESFPKTLSKIGATNILKRQLFHFGLQGEHQDGFFEAADEVADEYNSIYKDARNWVIKNYPYLNVPTNV